MTNYGMQYWLYAILNKQFGKEVQFRRDPLHSCYSANRHSFSVSTNTLPVDTVQDKLIDRLMLAGYTLNQSSGSGNYQKVFRVNGRTEHRYISISKRWSRTGTQSHLEVRGGICK